MVLLLDTLPEMLCEVQQECAENRSDRSMGFATNGSPPQREKRPPMG
jgi:hypothetical protein